MRIGISVITREGQNIWENGLGQNVAFLVQLFSRLAFVEEVVLLDCGNQGRLPPQVEACFAPVPRLIRPREATGLLDLIIEMGGGLDPEWLDYERTRGTRVIFHCCGQPYVGLVEPYVFGKNGYSARAARCDAVWILPKDRRYSSMLEALHNCPVIEVPYLWGTEFVDHRSRELVASGLNFGYEPPVPDAALNSLRVAIFEPNISVVKACVIPMLVCDTAYRADSAAIEGMHVLNSEHMTEHLTFSYLSSSLDLVKAGHAHFTGRHDFPGYMAAHANAVVSHQWNNDQNYVYMEALYGGYPLIHNSSWLGSDIGYYYPDFDVAAGADRLLWAAYYHHDNLDDYRRRATQFIARHSPVATCNIDSYARLVLEAGGKSWRNAWKAQKA
ncbi:DUF2827 family protein [Paraburkholderia heleia]|uniref:DUF2827 family protein n=1 Tax=Paraburkholderia heleia TaxID=634127 RepID=UPI002AB71AA0|nr:DUF2827 family protein [Paraburkholderia heleia]